MQLILIVSAVLLTAFLFYGLIPGIGAFSARASWRSFRRRILEVSLFPFIQYSDLVDKHRLIGNFRFFGNLEAIKGKNSIWLNNGTFTVEADLKNVNIYLLPSYAYGRENQLLERLEETLPDEEPKSVPWQRIFSLPAGTKVFVGGALYSESGRGVFRDQSKEPLLVVIYDGAKETILLRAIWGGRKRNEYWNRYTLPSLITGSFSLLVTGYLLMGTPQLHLAVLIALALSFFPIAALLPPGVILYFFYNYLWKRARRLRAERDMFRLPMRCFVKQVDLQPGSASEIESVVRLPTGEEYIMTSGCFYRINGNLRIRGSRGSVASLTANGKYFIFGVIDRERNLISESADPMVELVLLLGDPEILSHRCSRRARILEIAAALLIFSGLLINLYLILNILHYLIR